MLSRTRFSAVVAISVSTLLAGVALSSGSANAGPPAPSNRKDLSAFHGLGTWVDAYDFSREKNPGATPPVAPSAVDAMARDGVKTLYIQAAKMDSDTPGPLLSPDLLGQFLTKAHNDGMRVVAWVLPTLTGPTADWNKVKAVLDFRANGQGFDSFGLDIESRAEQDVNARNTRLIHLSNKIRSYVGDRLPLAAIVLPPVVTDIINTQYWPNFPWLKLKYTYDVWMPMAYYTNRTQSSGYRDPRKYIDDNVTLLRRDLHTTIGAVHAVGGIGDNSTTEDLKQYLRGLRDSRSIGGSIYDWNTTHADAWSVLRNVPR